MTNHVASFYISSGTPSEVGTPTPDVTSGRRSENGSFLKPMLLNRRDFLKVTVSASGYLLAARTADLYAAELAWHEALYYKNLDKNTVQCQRCPNHCLIRKGERGFCRVRENRGGKLYNIVYGKPCAVHVDPIEKKPFFHVLPGTNSFSIATAGCNLRCKFCQNWQISQASPETVQNVDMPAREVSAMAKKSRCLSVAYTYTEPTVFYEYTLDAAKAAQDNGLKNVMHSNGYIEPEPLRNLCPYFTAINVDLKAFSEKFYREICSGALKTVLESLIIIKKEKEVWLEITNLLIPTLNDDMEAIKNMCLWIKDNLGPDTPVHFSRFFPMHKLTGLPPTPVKTLEQARNMALASGLQFAYIGNIPGHEGENTYCPSCKKAVIKRTGYLVSANLLSNGYCSYCKEKLPGVWS